MCYYRLIACDSAHLITVLHTATVATMQPSEGAVLLG
jgi:hypothetical protein